MSSHAHKAPAKDGGAVLKRASTTEPSADAGCAAAEPFALRVVGDSMEPEFKDGCIIIVDPSADAKHGSYVVADTPDGPTFRRLVAEHDRWLLEPLNSGYETLALESKRAVTGVVVQRSGVRRSEHKHYV